MYIYGNYIAFGETDYDLEVGFLFKKNCFSCRKSAQTKDLKCLIYFSLQKSAITAQHLPETNNRTLNIW